MQLILTPPPKVMVILKEISFNCGSPGEVISAGSGLTGFLWVAAHARLTTML